MNYPPASPPSPEDPNPYGYPAPTSPYDQTPAYPPPPHAELGALFGQPQPGYPTPPPPGYPPLGPDYPPPTYDIDSLVPRPTLPHNDSAAAALEIPKPDEE